MFPVVRNKNTRKFLNIVQRDLTDAGVKLSFKKTCRDGKLDCGGYFDDTDKKIVVLKDRKWLWTLVHEYSHFIQWRDRHKSFLAYTKYCYDPLVVMEKWLGKEIKHSKNLKNSFNIIRLNEMECDLLATKLIKKYNLPINLDEYRKFSNHYQVFYHCVEQKRTWNASDKFFDSKMMNLMPSKIYKSYAKKVPDRIIQPALNAFE